MYICKKSLPCPKMGSLIISSAGKTGPEAHFYDRAEDCLSTQSTNEVATLEK